MPGPDPATAAIRRAVRGALVPMTPGDTVLVACSGGSDSLALAAAVAFEAPRLGIRAGAVVVDHGLQEGSAAVATTVRERLASLGLDPVELVRVAVEPAGEGVEAAARDARHAALEEAAARHTARAVLLGHTVDDQAEQVLLGLTRGAGARSLAGMPPARGRLLRPLLGIGRRDTRRSLEAQGLRWWEDPMNEDPAFLRVRARRALADLEADLGPGIVAALARSADQLREDADLLDALADAALADLRPGSRYSEAEGGSRNTSNGGGSVGSRYSEAEGGSRNTSNGGGSVGEEAGVVVDLALLAELPRPVRGRVWRRLLIAAGAPAGQVATRHTHACDALLTSWHGQGPLHVPGGLRVARSGGRISIGPSTPVEWGPQDRPGAMDRAPAAPLSTAPESQE